MAFIDDKTDYNKHLNTYEVRTIRDLLRKIDDILTNAGIDIAQLDTASYERREQMKRNILYQVSALVRENAKLSNEISKRTVRSQLPNSVIKSPLQKKSKLKKIRKRK